jgi:hypothetical protein
MTAAAMKAALPNLEARILRKIRKRRVAAQI